MGDILYNCSLIIFALAAVIYFRAQKSPWPTCIILAIISPILLMTFNSLFTMVSGLDFIIASVVLSLGFLIFSIKHTIDKRAQQNEKPASPEDS